MQGQATFDNIDQLFALGLAAVRLGDLARTEAAVEHLDNASRTLPDRDAAAVAQIMSAELDGELRLARGDRRGAVAALARAAQMEAARPRPIARPYPVKPAGELYADALLRMGNPQEAVKEFQKALMRTPRRAPSLLGLARAALAAG